MALPRPLATLLWLPVNALQALYTVVWSAAWISLALAAAAVAGPRPALALARTAWAPGLLLGAGARLVVRGAERLSGERSRLIVANHQSWMDVPALFRALPVGLRFVAKRELGRVPFLGWYLRGLGMVLVDRRDARRAAAAVDRSAELLRDGATVVSFPEGTRSRDGALGRFKSGGFGAALAAGAEVLPVAIVGSGRVLPPGGFRIRPGTIEVRVGAPLDLARCAPGNRTAVARAAEDAVRELLATGAT